MSRTMRLLAAVLLATLPLLAVAQSEETLQRHTVALENLRLSVSQLGADNTASLDALESAASTMRLVSQDTASQTLLVAMNQAFDNARTAIGNQSATDLAVQTAVLRGGFQRALLESALDSGSSESASRGFSQLASENGLDLDALDALEAASSVSEQLQQYRAGLARSMAARLATVEERFPESRAEAYVTLAGVYGSSLSLQDAPGTPASLNADFSALIDAVVNAGPAEVSELSAGLTAVLSQLGTAPPAAQAPSETAPEEVAPEPAPPALDAVPEPEVPAESEPAPEPAAEPAQETALPAVATEPEGEAAEETVTAAVDLETLRAELLASQTQLELDGLINDLGRRGVRGQAGENLASLLHGRGYTSVAQVTSHSLDLAGRASAAAAEGNQAAVQQYLGQLTSQYRGGLAPLVSRLDPATDGKIQDLIGSLSGFPVVGVSDVQPLLGLLAGVATTGSNTALHGLQADVTRLAGGWPIQLLLIVAALLAILPLVLLRLAFGGGNRNWNLIATGQFLLLLPLILAGLAALAGLIGNLAGIPLLNELAAWVTLSGSLQQVLLLIVYLLAIILISSGLYGICRQFGLFGGTGNQGRSTRGRGGEGKSENKTLVDWDEEF